MMLIEAPEGGERAVVESLTGYAGWTVVAEGIDPPEPFQKWDDAQNRWVDDPEARVAHERLQLARDPQALLALIDQLRAQINGGG